MSSAGHSFDYSVWTAGTRITLCNVRWDNTYSNVVEFNSASALDSYLENNSGPTVSLTVSYAKVGKPISIDLPFNAVYGYNYLRVTNPAQPIKGDEPRTFYYFILDVIHVAPNTTQLIVQLDVFQSFIRHAKIGRCFVERGHIGIANRLQFDDHGREYLTVPEGLDVGNEYVLGRTWAQDLHDYMRYSVVIATTVSLKPRFFGTETKPLMESAQGSWPGGIPSGMETYLFNEVSDFMNFMIGMSDKPWITQGIISVTAIPSIGNLVDDAESFKKVTIGGMDDVNVYEYYGVRTLGNVYKIANGFRESVLPWRYRNLKKFLTYPYMAVELTTYSGTPVVLKPECIPGEDITVAMATQATPPNPRVVVFPVGYNAKRNSSIPTDFVSIMQGNDPGEFFDLTTGIFNLPQFPIVNNGYLAYMASNANSISFSHSSADWSQQRTLAGNALSFDQASAGIDLSNRLTGMNVAASNASLGVQNNAQMMGVGLNGAAGIIGGAATGGAAGAGMGAVNALMSGANAAIDMNARTQQNAISTRLALDSNNATTSNTGYVRDTNRAYADYAAKGDYQNTIASINAKVQDAKLIQPTVSGQSGGDAFNLGVYKWAIHARLKQLQPGIMAMIGEYWLRYGYAVNRFANITTLQVMKKFTYWKLRETYLISATMPESFKATLRGILEKGVTVWSNPDDIGILDPADNDPVEGVTL